MEIGGGAEVPVCRFKYESVRLVLFCSSKEHPLTGRLLQAKASEVVPPQQRPLAL